MGKLIDADDLIKRIAQIHGNLNTKNVGQAIDDMPDATPRQRFLIDEDGKITPLSEPKKGKWIVDGRHPNYLLRCSACQEIAMWAGGISYIYPNFCPKCGAEMENADERFNQ